MQSLFPELVRKSELCFGKGLKTYVAGWTDPEIKSYLGARFTFTKHAVYIRNPVLRFVLSRLKRLFESDSQWQETKASSKN